MPEYSSTTLTPTDATKVPAMQDSNAGNFQLDALKAYILSQAGLANGLATLDAEGKLNAAQIPVNLDDVLVYASYASLPATGETGKLYITMDVNGSYYWNGTSYQPLGNKAANYRGTVSTLPSNPHNADWFVAKTTFTDGGVTYTAGHIYLYDEAGAKWDDETNNFGQFVLKSQISQTIGNEADLIPSNAAVNGAINAIISSSPIIVYKDMEWKATHEFTIPSGIYYFIFISDEGDFGVGRTWGDGTGAVRLLHKIAITSASITNGTATFNISPQRGLVVCKF